VDSAALRLRVEEHVRRNDLIPPGGEVTCLVSGGADSTCLWHALRTLGYAVSALHVAHGLRGDESDGDAAFCRKALGAEIVELPGHGRTEAQLRELRYGVATDRLRATGHTAGDQVETVLYRLVSSGQVGRAIEVRRADGVVRPLLAVWGEETEAYCRAERLDFRVDSTNRATKRGLIRSEILPALARVHPAARENLLRLADEPPRVTPALAELLASEAGSKRVDIGGGVQAVREYDRVWLERGPVPLDGRVEWGGWTIESDMPGLHVRGWRPGDHLAGRRKKLQDVFVDAKIPRSEREAWPLVVRGDEVLAVPGIVDAEGVKVSRA
jgi:tRNA(Ile)-lysidine synthase